MKLEQTNTGASPQRNSTANTSCDNRGKNDLEVKAAAGDSNNSKIMSLPVIQNGSSGKCGMQPISQNHSPTHTVTISYRYSEQPFACFEESSCPMRFQTKNCQAHHHAVSHGSNRPYYCDNCYNINIKSQYQFKYELKDHEKTCYCLNKKKKEQIKQASKNKKTVSVRF